MQKQITKYGELEGISSIEQYADGGMKECILNRENKIVTPYGELIPQYGDDGVRRKYTKSMSFHENGSLKSISLHQQTMVQTPIGEFPAELITFYENGNIKRLFPLNGKITGYWTEENEYKLAQEFDFRFEFGNFRKKILGIYFYENGAVKSLTFWPGDFVTVKMPLSEMETRIGIALYPEGRIKSIEPNRPTVINTPIGEITAFDVNAIGVHGDQNSLCFYEDGSVKNITTSSEEITIESRDGKKITHKPALKPSLLISGKVDLIPLQVHFFDGKMRVNHSFVNTYEIERSVFTIHRSTEIRNSKCSGCSGCNGCG